LLVVQKVIGISIVCDVIGVRACGELLLLCLLRRVDEAKADSERGSRFVRIGKVGGRR